MLITCPSCDTGFSVPDYLIGPNGRVVRCAKCAHQWHHTPETAEIPETVPPPQQDIAETISDAVATGQSPLAAFAPKPGDKSEDETSSPLRTPFSAGTPLMQSRKKRRFPWAAILFLPLLAAGGGFGYLYWDQVKPALAASMDYVEGLTGKLTAKINFGTEEPLPDDNLEIGNVKFVRQTAGGQTTITIEADIFNPADHIQQIPVMIAIALDKEGKQLPPPRSFSITAASIQPGETLAFRTILLNPPMEAQSLRIGFSQ